MRVAGSSSCNVWKRCRSVLWPQKQQLQRLGALQERSVASEAAVAATRSVAAARGVTVPGPLQERHRSRIRMRILGPLVGEALGIFFLGKKLKMCKN